MPVTFRTKDPAYTGPTVFPVGTVLRDVLIATEHLPARFPAERFHPFRHGTRYVIAVRVTVTQHALALHGSRSGAPPGSGEPDSTLNTAAFGRTGLPITLQHLGKEYPGWLVPFSPSER